MNNKVLIVEDELPLRKALAMKLSKLGLNIFEAENGQEGLKLALKEKPDITLLDLRMPVMDGMSCLKEIRKDRWGKKAKVVLLSNNTQLEIPNEVMDDVEGYYVKASWSLKDLSNKIIGHLKS